MYIYLFYELVCLLFTCLQFFYKYILLTHSSCTILFHGVESFRLKWNVSNFLAKN